MYKKAIIFDFDGTIADCFTVVVGTIIEFAKTNGFEAMASRDIEDLRGFSARELARESGISFLKILLLAKRIQGAFAAEMEQIKLFPELARVLEELHCRGYVLGIVTSNTEENVRKFLERWHLAIFDFICSDKSVFGKGKIIRRLMRKHALSVGEVWYVGDEVRDIDAARKAGVKIASVSWGFNTRLLLEAHHPDRLIDVPEELLDTFQ